MSKKITRWLSGIIFLAVFIRTWFACRHDFLHEWDERYHALVAKNLLKHPFTPTLYDAPLFPYDFKEWAFNHIWLSKPILPLWMMSLSLNYWDLSVFAVRFPSILFSTGSVYLTYLIGKEMFGYRAGLAASFLHAIHGLSLEVAAGAFSSDHVDTIFLFWMELGFWQILKYNKHQALQKSNTANAAFIGLWFGLAFLSKWTPAMFLPMVWVVTSLVNQQTNLKKLFSEWLLSCFVAILVVTPWLWYILTSFPKEATYILRGIITPVNEVIQGHTGEWHFYLSKIHVIFGQLIFIPLLFLAWQSFKVYKSNRDAEITGILLLAAWVFVPLLALSIATTKRINYLLPMAPAFFILTGYFTLQVLAKIETKGMLKWGYRLVALALLLLPVRYFIERTNLFFNVQQYPEWMQRIKSLSENKQLNQPNVVVFNEPHAIETMFHTQCTAYNWRPSEAQITALKAQNLKVLILDERASYVEH